MKKLVGIFVLCFLFSCSNKSRDGNDNVCANYKMFGDVKICIPVFDSLVECSDESKVQFLAESIISENGTLLAFYLKNEVYNQVDSSDFIKRIENTNCYIMIYSLEQLKGIDANSNDLNNTYDAIKQQISSIEELGYIDDGVDNVYDFILSINEPTIIESYSINKNIKTTLIYVKSQIVGYEYLKALNLILIKDRIVFFNYFNHFSGEESIEQIKQNNKDFIIKFWKANQ